MFWSKSRSSWAIFYQGRAIFVEGRLKLDQWESKEGEKSAIRVVLDNFEFVDSRQDNSSPGIESQSDKSSVETNNVSQIV